MNIGSTILILSGAGLIIYGAYLTETERQDRVISANEITYITRCLAQSKEPVTRSKLDSCRDVAQRITEEGLVP